MNHRAGRITGSVTGEVHKTNSFLNKIMQYQEVPKNKYTRFGMKTDRS